MPSTVNNSPSKMPADDPADESKNDTAADPPKEDVHDDINDGDGGGENAQDKEGNAIETRDRSAESNGSKDENDLDSSKALDQFDSPENYAKDECNDAIEGGKSTTHPDQFKLTESKPSTKQYEYIKRGSRVKSLLSTALRAVADGFAAVEGEKKRECDEKDEEAASKKARGRRLANAEDLARDKMEECVILKQKIQNLQSQIQALQQENYASHQTSSQLQSKIDRTLTALQIASASSANARADADAAEAKADSLSREVEEFHSLVEEMRRGMEAIRGEHDEVSTAARSVEGRLIQVESELVRATKVKIEAEEERDGLKARAEGAERKARVLTDRVEDCEHEIRCLKKDVMEMEELEKIRSDRTNRIESELHVARGTLLEATSAAAEAESTVTSLNSVIEELRKENEHLHTQINDSRDSLHKDRNKQNEALTTAEKEVQKWKLKCEEEQEANRSLKMDKTTLEKQVEQMKSRMAHLERRMNDTTNDSSRLETPLASTSSAVTPVTPGLGLINSFGANGSMDSEPRKELTYVSTLPMRESSKPRYDDASRQLSYASSSFSSEKENRQNSLSTSVSSRPKQSHELPTLVKRKVAKSNKCCICQQDAMGMMKNCQCDKINCDKRAHMTCISRRNADKGVTASAVLCD